MKIAIPVTAALRLQKCFALFFPCKFGYAVLENILHSSSVYFAWNYVSVILVNLSYFSKQPVDQGICHCH